MSKRLRNSSLFSSPRVAWFVTFCSLLLVAACLVWIFVERSRDVRFENPYPLIDISRNFIPQEHFLTTIQPIREKVTELAGTFEKEGFEVSIYLEYLNTGANISYNPQTRIFPASLTKLPLALAVMKKVERGDWNLQNELILTHGDKDPTSGKAGELLSEYPIGTRFTIERLLEALLTHSDNTAFLILRRNLHEDDLNHVYSDLGLSDLFSDDGRMSAKEYSRLFRALYISSFLKREHSERILEMLDASPFSDFLAGPIPEGTPFPHKYGENIELLVYSDSGIVYIPNRPYLLTVMVQAPPGMPPEFSRERAERFMQEISTSAYTYFLIESL